MKRLLLFCLLLLLVSGTALAQPNDCNEAVPGCSTPSFHIDVPNPATNIVDFTSGTVSNPSSNPNASPGNAGCLLSGETSSTFITMTIVSNGTLAWSIQGPNGGCFDWIMWPYSATACADISGNTLPPVACNWNGSCQGFTGMCPPGGLPAGAAQNDFENALNVLAGQTYLLCLSNFSSTQQDVNLNFFGSALVVCGVDAPDQTICEGSSANVTINTTGIVANPTFQWLETAGVSNPAGGTNVTVTPTATTTYHVVVTDNTATPPFQDTAVFTITLVAPPLPNAGLDDTICLGSPILLNGTIGNVNDTYSWSAITTGINPSPTVNYAPSSTSLTPSVAVNQPGQYYFVLTESNVTCGISTDTVGVFVSSITHTTSQINPSCAGLSDGQININCGGAVQYSFDNGVTWINNSSLSGLAAGVYNVCSKNSEGCQFCSVVTLTDPVGVTITASNDTTICQNGTVNLIANATGGTTFLYHWSQTANTGNIQVDHPLATTAYTVFAENENGCLSPTETINVDVNSPISGTISPAVSICPGASTSLIATATGGATTTYTFTWSTAEVTTGTTSTINVSPPITTQYFVTITDNCESTPLILSTDVTILPLPVPQFSVLDDEICEPAVFTITNTTDPNLSGHLEWIISDGTVINDQELIHTPPLGEGYYNVTLIVTSPGGCIDTLTVMNTLFSMPSPEPSFGYSPNPVSIFNTDVSLLNTSFNSVSYEWFIDGGSPSYSNQEDIKTHFPDGIAATYEVTLIATSEFGCIDSVKEYITVVPEVLFYAPTAFTPNGDEFNQTWRVYADGIDIFGFTLKVYNRWGEVVWENNDPEVAWDGTYNGKKVQDGTYNWVAEAKDKYTDEKYRFKGSFNVIK